MSREINDLIKNYELAFEAISEIKEGCNNCGNKSYSIVLDGQKLLSTNSPYAEDFQVEGNGGTIESDYENWAEADLNFSDVQSIDEFEEGYLEHEIPKSLNVDIVGLDLKTSIRADQILGFDTSNDLIILITAIADEVEHLNSIDIILSIRPPGESRVELTRTLSVTKKGNDPNNPGNVLFQYSLPLDDIRKMLEPLGGDKEVATIHRFKGTSHKHLLRELGKNWHLRGVAEQAKSCGVGSASFPHERPDALKLLQTGGIALIELKDSSGVVHVKRFVQNPADILYYTGHGLGIGYSRPAASLNCLAIEDGHHHYCCWAKASDIIPHWKSTMDLNCFIIAGCSVLGVDGSKDPLTGDGLEWVNLVKFKGGPLNYLIGYGDWDSNEKDGPSGSTAPKDSSAGNAIASKLGKWISVNPTLNGIIKQWLMININHINFFAVGIDKDGVYWRVRRKKTLGWNVVHSGIAHTKLGPIKYVIETKRLI